MNCSLAVGAYRALNEGGRGESVSCSIGFSLDLGNPSPRISALLRVFSLGSFVLAQSLVIMA